MKLFTKYDMEQKRNIIIKVGRSAIENWKIIDNASEKDIWIHLKDIPSPHVIIESKEDSEKKEISIDTIIYAANKCKEYSKMKNSKK